jgi:hypothetical protein
MSNPTIPPSPPAGEGGTLSPPARFCSSCRFFQPGLSSAEFISYGQCRRRVPTAALLVQTTLGLAPAARPTWGNWPLVHPQIDWCGEHEPKDGAR